MAKSRGDPVYRKVQFAGQKFDLASVKPNAMSKRIRERNRPVVWHGQMVRMCTHGYVHQPIVDAPDSFAT
jgi:hypothetical protein